MDSQNVWHIRHVVDFTPAASEFERAGHAAGRWINQPKSRPHARKSLAHGRGVEDVALANARQAHNRSIRGKTEPARKSGQHGHWLARASLRIEIAKRPFARIA